MKSRHLQFLLAFLSCFSSKSSSCQNTPQAALEELVTTEKTEIAEKHFPEPVRKVLGELKKEDRAQTSQRLLLSEWLRARNFSVQKNEQGSGWDLLLSGRKLSSFSIAETYFSGSNALVRLQVQPAQDPGAEGTCYFVAMRLEAGDWQITGYGPWRSTSFESDDLVRSFTPTGNNETSAQSTLREIWSALQNYQRRFPQVGYPSTLQALSGPEQEEQRQDEGQGQVATQPDTEEEEEVTQQDSRKNLPVPQYARMLDPAFLEEPPVRNGYKFHYVLIDSGNAEQSQGKFHITATPVEFGKTGRRGFFIDESGQTRLTTEDREANENDPVLRSSSIFFPAEAAFAPESYYRSWQSVR